MTKATHRKARTPSNRLVRTGCLSCLAAGVKCNGITPECVSNASKHWQVNSGVTWQWHGTWRERRGLHLFIEYATAPDRIGPFGSPFWQRTAILACDHSPAIYHLATAIGSLHEHIYQRASLRTADLDGLRFALRQCNRSIKLLTAERHGSAEPEVALIACIMFTCFEALQGEPSTATAHTLQGRSLLGIVENRELYGRSLGLVEAAEVRPVLGGLEMQAKALQGKHMSVSETQHVGDMPDASYLYSLDHAHRTLRAAYIRLLLFVQDWYTHFDDDLEGMIALMAVKRSVYAPWFLQWKTAFRDLLAREAANMSLLDRKKVQILQANHLTMSMMGSSDQTGTRDVWSQFEWDFQQVVELSASVLSTLEMQAQPTLGNVHYPYLAYGLWVSEPLFITMSRCTNAEIRKQAAGLLFGERERKEHKKARMRANGQTTAFPSASTGNNACDWTIDQWIDYAGRTRIDTAMATFFGRFPVDYIEAPLFDANCA